MRVYLIGAGAIAREHASAATKLAAELHVTDLRPDVAAALARGFPGTTAHADVATMLASSPPRDDDVVVVATPPVSHREHALAGLASKRHVLCEKPLAMTVDEAIEMHRAARGVGRRLACCSARFSATRLSSTLRTRVAAGALGDVYQIVWRSRRRRARAGVEYQPASTWFVDKSKSGGGTLIDWGPYDVAMLTEILAPSAVEVRTANVAMPDVFAPNHPSVMDVDFHVGAAMIWHTARGPVPVTFERCSTTHGPDGSYFGIEGTRAAAAYEWSNFGGINRLTFHGDTTTDGATTTEAHEEPLDDVHGRPLRGLVDAIAGGTAGPVVDGVRAVFNLAVLRAIYDAADAGRPVTVSYDEIERRTK